jgi:hypothetical protein
MTSRLPRQIVEQQSHLVKVLPGLSKQELAQFQIQLGASIPPDIEDLLLYTAGFEFSPGFRHNPVGIVDFAGCGFGFEEMFPCSVPLLADGIGNFWVVDVDPSSGSWGAIFFACHDPAVVVMQAPELATFLLQVLEPDEGAPKATLDQIRNEAASRIWKDDPWLISLPEARGSPDSVVSNFAKQLPEDFRVADLRGRVVGSGFSWGVRGSNAIVQRAGGELVFGSGSLQASSKSF